MNKEPRNLATYKEFGKMLRAVADIYSQMGDTPLEEEGWEREEISNAIYFITNKHDCELPTPKGMSFGENSPLFFPASFCHCFLGHEVVHPQEGSPQA